MSCSSHRFTTHENTDAWIGGYNAFLRDRRNASHDWRMDGKPRMYREGYYAGLRLYGKVSESTIESRRESAELARDLKNFCAAVKKAKRNGRLEPGLHAD